MADEYVYMKKSTWTGICDNIRTKAGTTSTMTASEAETAISGISTGSAEDRLNGRLDGSAEGYVTTNAMEIVPYAMYQCTNITGVTAGNATTIGESAFEGCSALASISLPEAKHILESAFSFCRSLASISLPKAESIGESAFEESALESISLPEAEYIGKRAFGFCRSLASISLPKVDRITTGYIWEECLSITKIELPVCSNIDAEGIFTNTKNLSAICIGTALDSVCTLTSTLAFNFSAIDHQAGETFSATDTDRTYSATGYIYVPDNLVDAYKTATNWSVYADRIKGISTLTS